MFRGLSPGYCSLYVYFEDAQRYPIPIVVLVLVWQVGAAKVSHCSELCCWLRCLAVAAGVSFFRSKLHSKIIIDDNSFLMFFPFFYRHEANVTMTNFRLTRSALEYLLKYSSVATSGGDGGNMFWYMACWIWAYMSEYMIAKWSIEYALWVVNE